MKIFSDNFVKLGLGGSLVVMGLTSMASLVANANNVPVNTAKTQQISYTATGKTDRQTAKLFKQLMKNNPNIQVSAQIVKKARPTHSSQTGTVSVNYTLKGSTDVRTARKLIALFKNSRHIEVVANISGRKNSFTYQQKPKNRHFKPQYINPQSYYTMPFYYTPQGFQTVLIQPVNQPMIWYRMPVADVNKVSQHKSNSDPRYTYL